MTQLAISRKRNQTWSEISYLEADSAGGRVMSRTFLTWMSALIVVTGLLAGCAATPPAHTNSWLSYKYNSTCNNCQDLTDTNEAINYYCAIGVDPVGCAATPPNPSLTLYEWTNTYLFGRETTIYANLGDLRIGRFMQCSQTGQNVACSVTNYGPPPFDTAHNKRNCDWAGCDLRGVPFYDFPQIDQAILGAIEAEADYFDPDLHPFATVAMTFTASSGGTTGANDVKFYAFDQDGNLLLNPALDGEGPKTNPRMCMACHGGTYDPSTHSVTGASFLPFDVFYFRFFNKALGSIGSDLYNVSAFSNLNDEQESLRRQNAIVKATNQTPAIKEVIDGMYPDGVGNRDSLAVDGFVPNGWSGHENLYNSVVRQYCRTCHLASSTDFATYQKFKDSARSIENLVCETHDMPHAEVPYALFWLKDKLAQNDLREFLRNELPSGTDLHDCK